jgi:regulatory protein
LKSQQKRRHRISIFIDGEYRLSVSENAAVGLRVGKELSEDDIHRLEEEDEVEKAYQRALRSISRRPHAEQEIRRKIQRRGLSRPVQESVLNRLRSAGLLDDADFARIWVENRTVFRPRSARALAIELRQKGISKTEIDSALEGFDEAEAAYRAGQKAARRWKNVSEEEFRKKVGGYLSRRGFSYSMINSVISRLMSEITLLEEEREGES